MGNRGRAVCYKGVHSRGRAVVESVRPAWRVDRPGAGDLPESAERWCQRGLRER